MNHTKKIFLTILLALGIFAITAGIVIGLLTVVKPTTSTPKTVSTVTPTVNTTIPTFVKAAASENQLKGLAIGPVKSSQSFTYFVKSDSPQTYVGLTGSNAANLTSTTPFNAASIATAEAGVANVLQAQHYTKQTTPDLPSVIATYVDGNDAYCTLLGQVGSSQLNVVCADKAEYAPLLSTTQSLLQQWTGLASATYNFVTSQTVKSDDSVYQLASVVLMQSTTQKIAASLVFTKDGNNSWQYAADLVAPDGTHNGDGKTIQTPQVIKVMNDSHYGPLLNKLLGTTNPRQ